VLGEVRLDRSDAALVALTRGTPGGQGAPQLGSASTGFRDRHALVLDTPDGMTYEALASQAAAARRRGAQVALPLAPDP